MARVDRLEEARSDQRSKAEAERVLLETELNALRSKGVRHGSNEERRERWLKVRLRGLPGVGGPTAEPDPELES